MRSNPAVIEAYLGAQAPAGGEDPALDPGRQPGLQGHQVHLAGLVVLAEVEGQGRAAVVDGTGREPLGPVQVPEGPDFLLARGQAREGRIEQVGLAKV